MNSKSRSIIMLTFLLLICQFACPIFGDSAPNLFSPPFLRGAAPPFSTFHYLQPQESPLSSSKNFEENQPDFPENNKILNGQPADNSESENVGEILIPGHGNNNNVINHNGNHPIVTNNHRHEVSGVPSNFNPPLSPIVNNYIPALLYPQNSNNQFQNNNNDGQEVMGIQHQQQNSINNVPQLLQGSNINNLQTQLQPISNNIPQQMHGNTNIQPQHQQVSNINNIPQHQSQGNTYKKINRPQLRQLDLSPAVPVAKSVSSRRAVATAARSRTSATNNNVNRRGRSNQNRVSEGHRLITRALWRIFDALMEKNEKDALQERMNLVESAIKTLIASNTNIEDVINMVKVITIC